jgi:RimJ/RimL family protein N-acetyltransferase
MKIKSRLVGKRLFLRTLCAKDASARYLSWFSDADVTRYLEIRFSPPYAIEDLVSFIKETNDSNDSLMLGIFLRDGGLYIGNIKLGPINSHHGTGDIGLLMGDRNEWGKGYAREAIELLTEYAFFKLGLTKLTASCYSDNEGSRRAFCGAGFLEEGRREAQYLAYGKRQDGILLGKVNPMIEAST